MQTEETGRLDIEGCLNFRDAGGWRTTDGQTMRTGALYRGDDPVRLTAAGRRAVERLGIRAVVDLRQPVQVARSAGFLDSSVTFHRPLVDRVIDIDNPPPLAEPADLANVYDDMIERGRTQIAGVINVVAEHIGDGPVLVHCALGKDRTGMIVALVQAAIGVPLTSIAEEYGRSDEGARARRALMIAKPLPDDPPVARSPAYIWTAPAEAMRLIASRAETRYGSLEAWPASFGLRPSSIQRLRAALIVSSDEP